MCNRHLGEAGCTPTVLDPDNYDRTCSVDEDCVVVTLGDQCSCGGEQYAIRVDALEQATEDHEAARAACLPDLSGKVCAALPPSVAVCNAGTCEAQLEQF